MPFKDKLDKIKVKQKFSNSPIMPNILSSRDGTYSSVANIHTFRSQRRSYCMDFLTAFALRI